MKRIIRNKRILVIAFLTLFTASMTAAASENPALPVEFKYTGKLNNQPLFLLNVTGNETHNNYVINIRDSYGNVLYWENIKAESFSKKFLFNTNEIGNEKLFFEVTSRNTKQSVTYEINRHFETTEELSVKEVK